MESVQLTSGVHVLPGAVNMGLVETGAGLVAVDTGLDKQAAKRMLKAAEELGKPIVAIVNTHAHADHFGGNKTLLSRLEGIQVYAPVDEAAVIRQPVFEPQYLWQGAAPFNALQNKFLLAEKSPVHHEFAPDGVIEIGEVAFQSVYFPGHSHGQCGILVKEVLFAADAYFGKAVTDKHGLPFLVDYAKTLQSAQAVLTVEAGCWVPGHGDVSQNPAEDVHHLCERHESAMEILLSNLADGPSLDALVGRMCASFHLTPSNVGAWLLIRTSVAAYVTGAVEAGRAKCEVADGVLQVWPV